MPTADGKRFLINTSYAALGTGALAVVLDWASVIREPQQPLVARYLQSLAVR